MDTKFNYLVKATVKVSQPDGSVFTVELPHFVLDGDFLADREEARVQALAVVDPLRNYDTVTTQILPVVQALMS